MISLSEQLLVKGRILGLIPRFSAEWSVSFTVRMTSLISSGHCNIILITDGSEFGNYGSRTPAVYMDRTNNEVLMSYVNSVNGSPSWHQRYAQIPQINVPTHIELHQRYVSGGNYRFFVKMDGQEVFSILNTDARQFYNVKVYASGPNELTCAGYIKRFSITNFL